MKPSFKLFLLAAIIMVIGSQTVNAQFFKKLAKHVAEAAKEGVDQAATGHAVNDAGNATDKTIIKAENAAGNVVKGNGNSSSSDNSSNASTGSNASSGSGAIAGPPSIKTYQNYDFVPGDTVIFQSNLVDEQTGEIPSQLTVSNGQTDIQQINGENVIHIPKGAGVTFTPRMTNRNYMPDQFTVEFDYLNEVSPVNHITIQFGGNDGDDVDLDFWGGTLRWASADDIELPEALKIDPMKWQHFAVAVNKNAGKAYINQFRVVNVNDLAGKAENITFRVEGYEDSYIKNIRIAAGGIDVYKEVSTNSKIIMHGILFDVDKATLKPESMGSINQIYNLLKKDPSLKFEIDGHTDNTGDAAHNLTLSQQRADAVKTQLVKMGIDAGRLTTKGFGDTVPIADNSTPEGKANNRRVEFLRK